MMEIDRKLDVDSSAMAVDLHKEETSPLYLATYSGTKVIEMMINDQSIMRRKNDSTFNATQLLKLAGLDKSQRTKVLGDVQKGVHEKVQGGYGKFQGTWIPHDRAITLAQQYKVYDLLKPLLLYSPDGTRPLPTKEESLASIRKNKEMEDVTVSNPNSFYDNGAIHNNGHGLSRTYSVLTENDNDDIGNNSLNSLESPTKKLKLSPHIVREDKIDFEVFDHDLKEENSNYPYPLEPLTQDQVNDYEKSKELIPQVFLSTDNKLSDILKKEKVENINVDVSIDDLGHNALHWASTLARIPLVKELLERGCNRIRGNNKGESALVGAVLVTNNFETGTFGELLNYLYPCITLLDSQGSTVLHHIAYTAGIKGRSSASRYYLETLLEWIVKTGQYLPHNPIGIGKFMSDVVNCLDKNGDTCLNIAARIGNKSIVQQLLEVGADPFIPNKAGLRPVDFGDLGININGGLAKSADTPMTGTFSHNKKNGSLGLNGNNFQSSTKILESMRQMLSRLNNDFQQEIASKDKSIESLRNKLRTQSLKLSESRKILDDLKNNEVKLIELKQKITNIDKAIEEEEIKFREETDDQYGTINNFNVDFDADEPFRIWSVYNDFENRIKTNLLNNTYSNEKSQMNLNLDLNDFIENIDELNNLNANQIDLSDQPPSIILKARIKSYQQNEVNLINYLNDLNSKSKLLENKFRHVVSLCTGVDESTVDDLLEGLVQAVESDPDDVDIGRVAGYLRRVGEA